MRKLVTQRIKTAPFVAAIVAAIFLCVPLSLSATVLDDENRIDVVLSDGTNVVLYGESTSSSGRKSNKYYYLPVNLRLSNRPDGVPEFLFLKFTTEERAEAGGVGGAIMHFLTQWGLTREQEQELRGILEREHNKAELMGAVLMEPQDESGSFQIISGTLSDKGMTSSLVTSGKAPLIPGGKAAAAARLDQNGAQIMAATFDGKSSITDLSIALNFSYTVLAPAAKGRVIMDWEKYEKIHDSLEAEYKKWRSGTRSTKILGITVWSKPTYSYSYDEMREHFDFLMEKRVVDLQFDELIADERVAKIREAFFQYFLNAFAEAADTEAGAAPPPPSDDEKKSSPNIRYGNNYKFKQVFTSRSFKKKKQIFNLNYRMAIKRPCQLVGNLMSWYDAVRDNPACVSSVNLNDPFFQHRDIRFILDLDAKDIFDEVINYVTVNVRKKRSSGRPFEDRITIDADYLNKRGITASVTYARGEDTDPETYEYQVQWSLRGGILYPPNPEWQKGSWEGVTLAPPVMPRTIEVEGDLDGMRESQITRITVQVHYPKFGKEVEENIHLSPARNEPLVSKKIFMDGSAKGYAYRLVVNHKVEGKLALPWSAQVGDDYIYAAIPEELLVEPNFIAAAKEAAKDLEKSASEKVLHKFKELFKEEI